MHRDHWQRVNAILEQALELQSGDRDAFLQATCAEAPDLRREVEQLLEAHDGAGSFLESAKHETPADAPASPTLRPGNRLGPYEVGSQIGRGGMGEVYQARDTRLDRAVAIKVLPENVATDPKLKQRFEQEARTIAGLSHPNICALHDIGRHDDADFLVMEYLEGETLAERLERGALPLAQALRTAIEICGALDRAHGEGVVHRDLKPGNIMLTRTGAKLLDFGLAKLRPGTVSSGASAARLPAGDLTGAGEILGTTRYMAPEQLEGKPSDARTDIFALGAVVYEMVTGRTPFTADSQAGLVGAILKDQPPAVSFLVPSVPIALDRIVSTCLTKDPDDRWQTARDLGRELAWTADGFSSAEERSPSPPVTSGRASRGTRTSALVVAGVTIGLLGGWAFWNGPSPASDVPRVPTSFVLTTPADGPLRVYGDLPQVAFSPDGTTIAYAAGYGGDSRRRLYVRDLGEVEARSLTGTERGDHPFFSPDGTQLGFRVRSSIKRIPVDGGPVQAVHEPPQGTPVGWPAGMTWGPDDTIVFSTPTSRGLLRVSAGGGDPQQLTTIDPDDPDVDHRWPEFLPDGSALLFTIWSGTPEASRLAHLSLETGAITDLTLRGTNPRYTERGHIVFGLDDALQAVSFDAGTLDITGIPTAVANDVDIKRSGAANFSVSRNGSLVYVEAGGQRTSLVWVDRNGREEPLDHPAQRYTGLRLSPDGTQIAAHVLEGDSGVTVFDWQLQPSSIWIYGISTPTRTRLTLDRVPIGAPLWTPDGKELLYAAVRDGKPGWYRQQGDGSSPVWIAPLRETRARVFDLLRPNAWSADGKTMVFSGLSPSPESGRDIGVLRVTDEPRSLPLLASQFRENAPALSPDGRWIAYCSWESGTPQVYVQRFPELGDRVTVSTGWGQEPAWSHDGQELYYRDRIGRQMMVVDVDTDPVFRAGAPRPLFDDRYHIVEQSRMYDVAPDGRFLMMRVEAPPDAIVGLDWVDELPRR